MLFKIRILLKVIVHKMFAKRTKLVNDEVYNKLLFFIMFGRKADFDAPRTFNEFICARKVRRSEYDLGVYTDKYEVRKYVNATIGQQYLNENYGIFESYDEIDFDMLPDRFVLRCTHGSGMNLVVTNKADLDHKNEKKKFQKWLKQNYYYLGREKNYRNIPPRISCDKLLECKSQEGLPEAKVFCFNGKAKLISYNRAVEGKIYTNYYDSDWNFIDVRIGYPQYSEIDSPENAKEILIVAEKLAAEFDFVRVDLFNVDGRIIFNELTFHSGGGLVSFTPASYDEAFGKWFLELEKPV